MESGACKSNPARRRHAGGVLAGLTAAMMALGGCAVHYSNPQTGTEQLWGLGQLRLKTNSVGTNWTAVTAGCRVSGLCVEVGRDHFGFSFGFLDRQRLAIVNNHELANVQPPSAQPAWLRASDVNARWAVGRLRMRSAGSPTHHVAIVTGKALTGLGAGWGSGDNSLSLGLASRQQTVVQDENARIELDQVAPCWPGFDLFTTEVHVAKASDLIQPTTLEAP